MWRNIPEEYKEQFIIRADKYLEKFERMEELYSTEENLPEEFWTVQKSQCAKLEALAEKFDEVIVLPSELEADKLSSTFSTGLYPVETPLARYIL